MIEDLTMTETELLNSFRTLEIPIPKTGDIIEFVFCPTEIKAKFKRGKRIRIFNIFTKKNGD